MRGEAIVADLLAHPYLWKAVIAGRFGGYDLGALQAMAQNIEEWQADTIFIYSSQNDNHELEQLARRWNPDEMEWMEQVEAEEMLEDSEVDEQQLLRLWWDGE